MVSKTSLAAAVRAFDWKAVDAGLKAEPGLTRHRDERGRNWLHLCCATPLGNRPPKDSIRTADILLKHGIDVHDHAFTEGTWKATPVWFAISRGLNLALARHLIGLGASPQYSLFAAAWNNDAAAIDLLVRAGADLEEGAGQGSTPFLGAIAWSRFAPAWALARHGANVNAQDKAGMTAAHLMLTKASPLAHFKELARLGARFDIPNAAGKTAADIMRRKKDPAFRKLAGASPSPGPKRKA
jgi:hypothetical protein